MQIANMCSLPMVFFLIQILNKRALLSRNEICRKYALFRIFFYSDLTQTLLRHLSQKMVTGASGRQFQIFLDIYSPLGGFDLVYGGQRTDGRWKRKLKLSREDRKKIK